MVGSGFKWVVVWVLYKLSRFQQWKARAQLSVTDAGRRGTSPRTAQTVVGGVDSERVERGKNTDTRVCHNCNEEGHISRNCPQNKESRKDTCYVCGSTGHFARNCPKCKL
jgi:hypothetical protein